MSGSQGGDPQFDPNPAARWEKSHGFRGYFCISVVYSMFWNCVSYKWRGEEQIVFSYTVNNITNQIASAVLCIGEIKGEVSWDLVIKPSNHNGNIITSMNMTKPHTKCDITSTSSVIRPETIPTYVTVDFHSAKLDFLSFRKTAIEV